MRRIASLALVFLLVLRGLLGDAMAMGLAPMPADAHATAPQAHEGRAMHCADGAASADTAGHHEQHDQHPACTACGICHSAVSVPGSVPALPLAAGGALHPHGGARFASAAAAQAIKPPIS